MKYFSQFNIFFFHIFSFLYTIFFPGSCENVSQYWTKFKTICNSSFLCTLIMFLFLLLSQVKVPCSALSLNFLRFIFAYFFLFLFCLMELQMLFQGYEGENQKLLGHNTLAQKNWGKTTSKKIITTPILVVVNIIVHLIVLIGASIYIFLLSSQNTSRNMECRRKNSARGPRYWWLDRYQWSGWYICARVSFAMICLMGLLIIFILSFHTTS